MQEILRYNNKVLNTYTSPHLLRFNERFEFKNEQISNESLEKALISIKEINTQKALHSLKQHQASFMIFVVEINLIIQ